MIRDLQRYSQIVTRFTRVNMIESHAEAIAKEIIDESPHKTRDFICIKLKEHSSLMEARIEHVRSDLLKWFISIISIQTIILFVSISMFR